MTLREEMEAEGRRLRAEIKLTSGETGNVRERIDLLMEASKERQRRIFAEYRFGLPAMR